MVLNKPKNKAKQKPKEETTVKDVFERKLQKKQQKGLLYFFCVVFFMIGLIFYLFSLKSSQIYYLETELENFKVAEISFITYSIDTLNIDLFSGDPSTLKPGTVVYLKGHVGPNGVVVADSFSKKIKFREPYLFKGVILDIEEDICNVKYRNLPYGLNSNQIKSLNINQNGKTSYGFIGLKIRNHKSYGVDSFSTLPPGK